MSRLGPYDLLEEIGRGGVATIYRAYQPTMDRYVAVKVIHKSIVENAQILERFRREARIIARLEHPHILPVYDFDGAHEPPYIVMRYLDSGTLKDMLKLGPLPLDKAGFLLRQIASALDYAHRQGVVHRDIKPTNIMLDRQGNAIVSDFGIARMIGGADTQLTADNVSVGTPAYMSPEQAAGEVDHRADIYALGVVLFEMLTGNLPFVADTPLDVVIMHIQDPVPSAAARNPALPQAIDQVIAHAMAKEPEDRYETATAFAEAVSTILGGTAIHVRQTVEEPAILRAKPEVGQPVEAAGADLQTTPSEQNKVVTAVYINAADYAVLVDARRTRHDDAHSALGALWAEAEKSVGQFGGQVFTRTEDTLLALWGAQTSRENDPERALRAALDIQAALRRLGAGVFEESEDELLPLKIGVSTGMALLTPTPPLSPPPAGGMRGGAGYTASGATISLPNRLAEHAEGAILISPDTYRAVRGVFDVVPDEPIKVHGRKERLPVYRVTAAKARAFRPETHGFEGIETQLIGREVEFKQMQQAFLTAVEDSETQWVTVVSEAGLGKSRLLFEFNKWAELRPEKYCLFRGRAAPDMPPYGLLRDVLAYRFEIHDNDSSPVVHGKLEQGVAELVSSISLRSAPGESSRPSVATTAEMAHLIGQLAGFDLAESPHIKPLLQEPQELVKRARAAWLRLFTTLCKNTPAVVELEDLHYADDATLDLFDELVRTQCDLRLMVLGAARPALRFAERRPKREGGQDELRLELHPLSKREERLLVRELLQKATDVPKALTELIVERAEGNPYYAEELVKALIEDRIIQKGGEVWTVEETRLEAWQRSVPPTLMGLLQTRLDSLLYPERVVLARAATLGRIFWDSAVAALEAGDGVQLKLADILAALVKREFIYERPTSSFAGNREYAFAQAMLRDVLYDSLVKRQQRAYHAAAAEWLAQAAGKRAAEYNAAIADHYEHAGETVQAAQYLLQAAQRASAVSAYPGAIAALERALALTPPPLSSPPQAGGIEGGKVRISTLALLGDVYGNKGAHAEAKHYLQEAVALARALGDQGGLVQALGQLARIAFWQGDYADGKAYLQEALPLARAMDDRPAVIFILRQLGNIAVKTDACAEADVYMQESLTLARQAGDREAVANALNGLALIAGHQDDYAGVIRLCEQALEIALALGRRRTAAMLLNNIGDGYCELKDYAAAAHYGRQAMEMARAIGADSMLLLAFNAVGRAMLGLGQVEAARGYLDDSLRLCRAMGEMPHLLLLLPIYARLFDQAGQRARALELLGLALAYPVIYPEERQKAHAALKDLTGQDMSDLPADVETALARGASLDLDAVVRELLGEAE